MIIKSSKLFTLSKFRKKASSINKNNSSKRLQLINYYYLLNEHNKSVFLTMAKDLSLNQTSD